MAARIVPNPVSSSALAIRVGIDFAKKNASPSGLAVKGKMEPG
jgi:hypothetical protein